MISLITLFLTITTITAAPTPQIYHTDQLPQQYHQPPRILQSEFGPQVYYDYVDQPQQLGNPAPPNQRQSLEHAARTLSHEFHFTDSGYQYAYETENGIKAYQVSQKQGPSISTQGSYSYTGDDGLVYTVNYIADENGFRAEGAHIPTPPPIPEGILKSLDNNKKAETIGFDNVHGNQHSLLNEQLLDQATSKQDYRSTDQHTEPSKNPEDTALVMYQNSNEGIRDAMFREEDKLVSMETGGSFRDAKMSL